MVMIYGHIDPANDRIADLMAERNEKDACIAELIEHLETVRKSYDECYAENEKLTAEVERLRDALAGVLLITLPLDQDDANAIDIARNALKEG